MKFLLPFAIILAFSFCYMEWGGGNSAFIFEVEKTVFQKDTNMLQTLTHPLIMFGLIGQLLLLVCAFTEGKKRKWFAWTGIGLLSIIVFFVLLAGALSMNWKALGSVVPFIALVCIYIWYFRKRPVPA
ncbi:MAG: hypothetical protein GC192_16855 [Bacteroidetes bacterium]|nr:hypothetical protein [Bacteroidota bacterium]